MSSDGGRDFGHDEEIVEFNNLTVKFRISDTQTVAQVYPNCLIIEEVKNDIGKKFEVDPTFLLIYQDDTLISDTTKLADVPTNDFGIVEVCLKICEDSPAGNEGRRPVLDLQVYYNKYRLTDFITVHIPPDEQNPGKELVVEIQNQSINKPFLGGYRNKNTGVEYLDAFSQTGPPLTKIKFSGVASRDCQTQNVQSKLIDTSVDVSAQVFGNATKLIHVTATTDYVIIPKPYVSSDEMERKQDKLGKIKLIQRNFRRYLLQRLIKNAAAEYRRLHDEQQKHEARNIEKYIQKFRTECVRKAFPKTKEDFDLLYAQVQRWKEAEIRRINEMYSGAPRIAELNCLLDREIQLLNGIEQQKNLIKKALRDFREEQRLKKMGEPLKWIGYRNMVVEIDLLRTQRVRQLMDLYKTLQVTTKKTDRIELMKQIAEILVRERDSPALVELLDLFQREKHLLMMSKMCQSDLAVLRKRQYTLLLEIIKDEKHLKTMHPESKMCCKCNAVKPMKEFALRTRQSSIEICKPCYYLKEAASSDSSHYKAILRTIQRDERKRGTLASFAFIMQEDDIRFIINNVWHGHSMLSHIKELSDLRLPRWIKTEDWSPWNCVCLTENETKAHLNVISLSDIYEDSLIQEVHNKHMLAKAAFKKVMDVDSEFVRSGDWWKVGTNDKVI